MIILINIDVFTYCKVYISLLILTISEEDMNSEHFVTASNSVGSQIYTIQFKSERYKLKTLFRFVVLISTFVSQMRFVCVKTSIGSVFLLIDGGKILYGGIKSITSIIAS